MEEAFAPDIPALLQPAATEPPCGPSVRYEQAFMQLRQSRAEDDASVPMGEWERPLVKADWRMVARNCMALLGRSKDLQLAAWLLDAWVRQHQLPGLIAGIELIGGLIEQYWDELHPKIEDGDSDARVSPFVWLNENLPVTLRLHVPLLFLDLPDRKFLNLTDWERIAMPQSVRDAQANDTGMDREQLLASVDAAGVKWLRQVRQDAQEAAQAWEDLSRALDDKLGADGPGMGKVADILRRLERACVSLLDGRGEPQTESMPASDESIPAASDDLPLAKEAPAMSATVAVTQIPIAVTGAIGSRQEAYRLLEAAAAYLQATEPHSPTPYLVRRAVAWGQLSLPDLMQEVLREEGDIGRFFSMLGIQRD